jgi:hypothetical protein
LGLALALAVGAAIVAIPTPALADPCGDDGTTKLFDSGGYYFDFGQGSTTGPDRNDPFATLFDSGSLGPAGTPPGPRLADDTYDDWGALFVGGNALTNLYHSNDNNACAVEDAGRERVYPVVTIGGLQVRRKIFVPASGLPGARILNLITNPGTSPLTTSVQVGDTLSNDSFGDLGSDGDTEVRASSSGDTVLSTADFWAVTSDDATTNSDLALAHVIDGMGGADRIDFVTLTGSDTTPQDNLTWRWDGVTIAPGETAAFMSFEVQQGVAGADAATENANAATQARNWESASFSVLYQGMTDAEIQAVRNWPKPPSPPSPPPGPGQRCKGTLATITGTAGNDVLTGTTGRDVVAALSGNDRVSTLGGNDLVCAGGGRDRANGGGGKDRLLGQGGNDRLRGAGGNDTLRGGGGRDRCNGGPGRDKGNCERETSIP